MIKTLICLFIACLASCQSQNDPKKQFQQFANDFSAAWSKHDPKALASFWTEDGDFLSFWSDNYYRGRQDIESYFAEEQTDKMKNSKIVFTVQNIRMIDPDTAFGDANFTISGMEIAGEKAAPLNGHAIFLFVKQNGKWEILIARPY